MVLIVTGGGRGIGAATARLAAERGYSICVNYLANRASAESVGADAARFGARAIVFQADVGVESDVVEMFEAAEQELGPVTALVNNAATLETQMRLESMDAARIERVLKTNVVGPILCAREAVRRMSTGREAKAARSSMCPQGLPAPDRLASMSITRRARGRWTRSRWVWRARRPRRAFA